MEMFLSGILTGLLLAFGLALCVFISADGVFKSCPRLIPPKRTRIERKRGNVSFYGMPGYQNIPCHIDIFHRYEHGFDKNMHVIKDHIEIRRYTLDLPLPALYRDAKLYHKVIDSDNVKSLAYFGAQNTLIQGG